jgi:hypothetical protein
MTRRLKALRIGLCAAVVRMIAAAEVSLAQGGASIKIKAA